MASFIATVKFMVAAPDIVIFVLKRDVKLQLTNRTVLGSTCRGVYAPRDIRVGSRQFKGAIQGGGHRDHVPMLLGDGRTSHVCTPLTPSVSE